MESLHLYSRNKKGGEGKIREDAERWKGGGEKVRRDQLEERRPPFLQNSRGEKLSSEM